MIKPDMKAYLHRATGAPGRTTLPATPVRAGKLIDMVQVAVSDEENFWRYTIECSDNSTVTTSHIRRLAIEWGILP